jgi:chromosome condensin MukBEF MukE localization factor
MFWFGLGMAAGVTVARKVSGAARRLTPAGAAENVGDAVRELALAVGSFGADVRAGMVEREAELRASVAARTGIDTSSHLASHGPDRTLPPERDTVRPRRTRRAASRA